MPLNDCEVVTSLETIDTTLSAGAVTISAALLSQGTQQVSALKATWSAISSVYVVGVEFDYVPTDASTPKRKTDVQPKGQLGWTESSGVVGGKTYTVRYRAVGAAPNTYGSWSAGTDIVALNAVPGSMTPGGVIVNPDGSTRPVQIEPYVTWGYNGQAITFPITFLGIPRPEFDLSLIGLPPFGAGERPLFTAGSLTAAGCILSLLKVVPDNPVVIQDTGATNLGGGTFTMHKSGVDDAANGSYLYIGTWGGTATFTGQTFNPDWNPFDPGSPFYIDTYECQIWINVYVNNGGGDVLVGNTTASATITNLEGGFEGCGVSGNWGCFGNFTSTLGQHAGYEFKVTSGVTLGGSGGVSTFSYVEYTTQDFSTTVTATPGDELVKVTFYPPNVSA